MSKRLGIHSSVLRFIIVNTKSHYDLKYENSQVVKLRNNFFILLFLIKIYLHLHCKCSATGGVFMIFCLLEGFQVCLIFMSPVWLHVLLLLKWLSLSPPFMFPVVQGQRILSLMLSPAKIVPTYNKSSIYY